MRLLIILTLIISQSWGQKRSKLKCEDLGKHAKDYASKGKNINCSSSEKLLEHRVKNNKFEKIKSMDFRHNYCFNCSDLKELSKKYSASKEMAKVIEVKCPSPKPPQKKIPPPEVKKEPTCEDLYELGSEMSKDQRKKFSELNCCHALKTNLIGKLDSVDGLVGSLKMKFITEANADNKDFKKLEGLGCIETCNIKSQVASVKEPVASSSKSQFSYGSCADYKLPQSQTSPSLFPLGGNSNLVSGLSSNESCSVINPGFDKGNIKKSAQQNNQIIYSLDEIDLIVEKIENGELKEDEYCPDIKSVQKVYTQPGGKFYGVSHTLAKQVESSNVLFVCPKQSSTNGKRVGSLFLNCCYPESKNLLEENFKSIGMEMGEGCQPKVGEFYKSKNGVAENIATQYSAQCTGREDFVVIDKILPLFPFDKKGKEGSAGPSEAIKK